MAPHSSTLAWKIPWTEEPGRLQSRGSLRSDTTERLHFHFSLSCIGEGNGTPLQYSCLENPRDGGAWWAAVYGVAQSQTQLKRLSSSSSSEKQAESLLKIHMEEGLKGGLQPGAPSPATISVPISLPLHHPGDQVPVSSQGHRGKWQAQGKGPAGSPGSLPPACVPLGCLL